jgi:peptide-methionine (R)-S-oxide reductase
MENPQPRSDSASVPSDSDLRKKLTPEQYHVTREKGTERPFTGKYLENHAQGTYLCVCCGQELFGSDRKFASGSGWPSFWAPVKADSIAEKADESHGMRRVEINCSRCGAHLGHVFDDGPRPTGMRYCVNSLSLDFRPGQGQET